MRAVLLLLAVLLGLLLCVTIVGAILPQGHVASRSMWLNQPQEAVWKAISDFAASPSWRDDLREAQQLPDNNGHPVWKEVYQDGMVLTLETVEAIPRRRLVRRIIGTNLQFGGTWVYEIAPSDGGTLLTITEHGEVYNPIFRFVSRFIVGHKATIDEYLTSLGRRFGAEVRLG